MGFFERGVLRKAEAGGMAAVRIPEEARRRETFPAVEFRDTRLGRVAFVQSTRVQVGFVFGQLLGEPKPKADALAESFAWPHWKTSGVLAYLEEFPEECRQEWEDLASCDPRSLKGSLPNLEHHELEVP